jgi:hypothetical protein
LFATEAGAIVVVAPGGDLTVKQVNPLNEEVYATPVFADGRIYIPHDTGAVRLR